MRDEVTGLIHRPKKPKIGDVFLCEHEFVIEVMDHFYRKNYVRTIRPKDHPLLYRRALRAIKREERVKVLEERRRARDAEAE